VAKGCHSSLTLCGNLSNDPATVPNRPRSGEGCSHGGRRDCSRAQDELQGRLVSWTQYGRTGNGVETSDSFRTAQGQEAETSTLERTRGARADWYQASIPRIRISESPPGDFATRARDLKLSASRASRSTNFYRYIAVSSHSQDRISCCSRNNVSSDHQSAISLALK
jgi:hypothetical protein